MMDFDIGSEEHMKAMWAGQSNVLVAVRVRPLMKHDIIKRSCVKVLDSKVVIILDPSFGDKQDILRANRNREKQYAFDYAFDQNASQLQTYNHTTKFLIHGVLDGYNATVFAYGQTGSGKTHTMIGSPSDPGIMVRVMEDLTSYSTEQGKKEGVEYKFTVSLLEIYNENIRDLLSDVEEYLDLREDPIKGPVVAGITEVEAKNGKEIMDLLTQGNAKRSQAATAANEVSSRSHAVLQVVVESKDKASGIVANIKVGKLSLVDLAGSERAANTKNVGARLVEGANINRSLLALGNCINALGEKGNKGNFVPYRDSKLTRLLKDSLGGNCRTVMIANISSAESSFEETLNTLKYANRAKNIKTNIQRNVLNVNYHISEYVQLIDNLRGEIKALKDQIGTGVRISSAVSRGPFNAERNNVGATSPIPSPLHAGLRHPTTPLHILRESMKSAASMNGANGEGRELVNMMREKIVENFQERMQLRRSLIELEDQNVQNSIEVSKRQLIVVQWSEGSNTPGKPKNEQMTRADFSAHLLANASTEIKDAWLECEQLRKAIMKNNGMKKSIAKRLRHNEREAEKFKDELSTKITGEDRRELMELQYQVGRLELENMELEQHRIVHESIVKGKDLVIQKLRLQLAVRDKIIQRQKVVLKDNSLDELVGYTQMALMEETLMGDYEMLSSQIVPPSPPRNMADMRPRNMAPLIPQLEMPVRQIGFNLDDDDGPLTDIREISLTDRDRESIEAGDWSEIQSELSDNSLNDSSVRARHGKKDVFMADSSLESSSRMEVIAKGLRGQAGPRGGRHYRSTGVDEGSSEKLPLRPNNARSSNVHENKSEPFDDYDFAPGKSLEPLSIQAKGYYNEDPDLELGKDAQIRKRQEAATKLQQQQSKVSKNRRNQDGGQLSPGRGSEYAVIHPTDEKESGGGVRAGGIRDMSNAVDKLAVRGINNNANTKMKQQDSEKWVKAELEMQLQTSDSNQKPFDFQQPPQVAKYFANQNPANQQQNAFKSNFHERQGYKSNKQDMINDDFGEDSVDTIHSDDNSEYSEGGRAKYGNKQMQLQGRGYDLDENGQPKKTGNKNLVLGKLKNRLGSNNPVLGQYGGPNLGMPNNNVVASGGPQIVPTTGNYSERPQNPITAGIMASAGSFQDRIPSGQSLGLLGPGLGGISRPGPKVKLGGPVRDSRREVTNPKLIKQSNDVSNTPVQGVIIPNIGGRNRSLPNLPKGGNGPDSARSQGGGKGKG